MEETREGEEWEMKDGNSDDETKDRKNARTSGGKNGKTSDEGRMGNEGGR
jgi:hypothetical protein